MIIKFRTDVKSLNPTRVLQNKKVRRNAERFLAKLKRSPISNDAFTNSYWLTADGKVVDSCKPSCLYFSQRGDTVKIERSIYWYPGLTE